jgi:hypothetical protein
LSIGLIVSAARNLEEAAASRLFGPRATLKRPPLAAARASPAMRPDDGWDRVVAAKDVPLAAT